MFTFINLFTAHFFCRCGICILWAMKYKLLWTFPTYDSITLGGSHKCRTNISILPIYKALVGLHFERWRSRLNYSLIVLARAIVQNTKRKDFWAYVTRKWNCLWIFNKNELWCKHHSVYESVNMIPSFLGSY